MYRKLKWIGILTLIFALTFGLVGQALAADRDESTGSQRMIVTFENGVNNAAKDALCKKFGGESLKSLPLINGRVVMLPPQATADIANSQGVLSIELDDIVEATWQSTPWGIDRIDADLVHPTNKGAGVKVAVIDSGIDYVHEDLAGNFDPDLLGYDFVNDDIYPMDDFGHGTHVAGIIAAEDNNIGVIGVAPEANLYALKVLNSNGIGYYSDIIEALEWCVDNEMQIANISLGGSSSSDSLELACNNAFDAGVLLIAAAGNTGSSEVLYPANYNSVIAVAATDPADNWASFSAYSDQVELAAHGVTIHSTLPGGEYGLKSGTSMATPHVAGTAALVIASGITGSSAVRDRLDNTAEDLGAIGRDQYYGFGLVDAEAAAFSSVARGTISGTVSSAGEPIVDAIVTAGGYSSTTADDGSYTLADLPTGTYTITASATDYADASEEVVEILQNQTTIVDFTLVTTPLGNENDMYVRSITFSKKQTGENTFLFINVNIARDSNSNGSFDESDLTVAGADIELTLFNLDKKVSWTYSGVTDSNGQLQFMLRKAPEGKYIAKVSSLTHNSYTWNYSLDTESTSYSMEY